MKKILVWLSVFLLLPLLFGVIIYILKGEKNPYFKQISPLVNDTKKVVDTIIPDFPITETYTIGDLSGSTLKVPLIDDVIIPLSNEMSFNYDGKSFQVKQVGSIMTETSTKLIPLLVSQLEGKNFNFITAYTQSGKEWKQRQSVFLGNDISYKTISFTGSILAVEFNDTTHDDVKKYFLVKDGQISPYYPSIMKGNVTGGFISTKWMWKKSKEADNTEITPKQADQFMIRFDQDGNFTADTDCNKAIAKFRLDENKFFLSELATTRMACEGSQESFFLDRIKKVTTFKMESKQLELYGSGFTLEFSAE